MSAWTAVELERIGAAYEGELSAGGVEPMVSPEARATTLRLTPRDTDT